MYIIVLNVHAPSEEKCDESKDSFYEESEQVFDHFPKYHMKILLGDFNAKVGREEERKQTKKQWIQDPSRSNVDNLNNIRRDASRHFRNKNKAYLKIKIEELETNSKINKVRDLHRGINDFKKGYQPRTTIVKDEKGVLVADPHSILARWRNYFSQLLNVHEVKDIRQAEIHIVEPLVSEPSAFGVELAIEKLKNYKSPGTDQIPAEMIKAGGKRICCDIHKLIISVWNKEELPDE